ncbi:hypothetical protein, partial [Cronobacter sakazakii]|uniref:hypothetical protein n=1 Tax=Cronobacter sakazakii TaxID=28141 RepID=UPI003F78BF6C
MNVVSLTGALFFASCRCADAHFSAPSQRRISAAYRKVLLFASLSPRHGTGLKRKIMHFRDAPEPLQCKANAVMTLE